MSSLQRIDSNIAVFGSLDNLDLQVIQDQLGQVILNSQRQTNFNLVERQHIINYRASLSVFVSYLSKYLQKEQKYYQLLNEVDILSPCRITVNLTSGREVIINLQESENFVDKLVSIMSKIEYHDLYNLIADSNNGGTFDDILFDFAIKLLKGQEIPHSYALFKNILDASIKDKGLAALYWHLVLFNNSEGSQNVINDVSDSEFRNYLLVQTYVVMALEDDELAIQYINAKLTGVSKEIALTAISAIRLFIDLSHTSTPLPEEYFEKIMTFNKANIKEVLEAVGLVDDINLKNSVYLAVCKAFIKMGDFEEALSAVKLIKNGKLKNNSIGLILICSACRMNFEFVNENINEINDLLLKQNISRVSDSLVKLFSGSSSSSESEVCFLT